MISRAILTIFVATLAGCGDNRDVQYFIEHKIEREIAFEKCKKEEGLMARTQLCKNVYLAAKKVNMEELEYSIDRKK